MSVLSIERSVRESTSVKPKDEEEHHMAEEFFEKNIRRHWRLREDMTFLNNGSFGATPLEVLEAQRQWQDRLEQQPVEFVTRILPPAMRAAAAELAEFLGADDQDVVFVENASTGVSTVIHSLGDELQAGDEMLTTTHVYNAVRQTMQHVCQRHNFQYREVDVPFPISDAQVVRQIIRDAISDKTRFVLVDHVTSPTGIVFPVKDIIRDCQERNIPIMIDGAHAPGMLDLNLRDLDADWYTGNFHKWLFAPKGSAFLYTKRERQEMTQPLVPSHGYRQGYATAFDYIGTKDWSPYLAAVDGLHFFQKLGPERVRQHNNSLALKARQLLLEVLPQPEPAPVSMLASLASVVLPMKADEVTFEVTQKIHDRLWDNYRIEVPVFPFGQSMLLRVAVQVFNTEEEYKRLCSVIPELLAHA